MAAGLIRLLLFNGILGVGSRQPQSTSRLMLVSMNLR